MCGGSGTRVWPELRESLPKQFIPLIGDRSTFQSIVGVVGDGEVFERPVVITNFDYRFRVAEQLKEIGAEATILLEPERRDSARGGGSGGRMGGGPGSDAIVAVLAADHVFKDEKGFARLCAEAGKAAEAGEIVTFGVKPDHPATGYGYIQPGEPLAADPKIRRVERFVEKPSEERAQTFIESGYLWNSGNFVFRADVMLGELKAFEPTIAAATAEAVALAKTDLDFLVLDRDAFTRAPRTSIDYAVMERTSRAAVLEADVGWSDVGQWSTVWRLSPQDENGNSLRGRVVAIDSSNMLVRSDEHLAAVIGLDNVIVVATGDAVLVARPVAVGQGQGSRCAAEGGESAGGDAAPTHVSPLGLLPEHRPGPALPGQANRRQGRRPPVAAKALPSRRALDCRAWGCGSDAERGGAARARKRVRSICRSAPITGWPIRARSTSS